MTDKTKEQELAQEQLNSILNQTRPKNLGEGIKSGMSNIVSGAVGAVGVAVLAPVAGVTRGAQQGGIIGGTVGLLGGAVVGVVGAGVVAVSGVVSGITQIGRGVAAMPKSITEPRKGNWWDENQGKWIETNLQSEKELLSHVPADDEDILGDARNGNEAEISKDALDAKKSGVFETYYYEVLEVDPLAEESKIRRQYYKLAKKYHPDKVGKDDQEAANKFKEVAEAYQVLSDEKLRDVYNKKGREGLNATRTSVAIGVPKLDPAILFAFLFGSDKFHDYIGSLAMATSASIDDPSKVTLQGSRIIQQRRCARLAISLADRLTDYTNDNISKAQELWKAEAAELVQASYGIQLLKVIGQVYSLAAVQFLGSLDSGIGMPSISKWAKGQSAQLKKKSGKQHDNLNILKAGMKVAEAQAKAQEAIVNAQNDEEREHVQRQAEEEMGDLMLNVIWTTTVVDITATLHEACQMVLFDKSVDKDTRKKRGLALKNLGEVFYETENPKDMDEKSAKEMYEEAALAAMLDTVAKKEQAAYNASISHS